MLVIRDEQMEVLSEYCRRSFVERMIAHIDETYPGVIKDKFGADTGSFVSAGVAKAERYGIVYEDDIEAFLDMMARLGPDFDADPRYPWAPEVLDDAERSGSAKVALLQEHEAFGL